MYRSTRSLLLVLALLATPLAADPPDELRASFRLSPVPFEAEVEQTAPQEMDQLLGLQRHRVRFPSALETPVERNNTVDGILFEPVQSTDRALIFLPWFKDRNTENGELICRIFAASGYEVFFMPLGYQFGRAPEGWGSGSYILGGARSIDDVELWARQAVLDVQRTRQFLMEERGMAADRIGVVGISLGGFIASLTYGLVPELEAAAVVLAGGNLAPYLKLASQLGIEQITEKLERWQLDPSELEARIAPMDPVTWADPARKEGIYLVNSLFDPLIPMPLAQDLWNAWGRPNRMLLPAGHSTAAAFSPFILGGVLEHFEEQLPR